MIRLMVSLLLLLAAHAAFAQDPQEPVLRTELEADAAIPGQPVILRLTVLAPTWFPKPPDLPTFDMPNLMVRLPPRSTFPVSERIGGDTWSGISRVYRLYPLIPGIFEIPSQTVRVHYAVPGTSDPATVELQTEALTLSGTVPAEAIGLDPFVAARALELEQTIEGEVADLEPGAAVTRRLRVSIEGAPPMSIPPLLVAQRAPGLSAYAVEPVLEEVVEDGILSGSRTEQVTYVAESGGRFVLPAVRMDWFNLDSGQIESLQAEGFEITVRGPPPAATEPRTPPQVIVLLGLSLLVAAMLAVVVWRRLSPRFGAWRQSRRERYLASERYAYRQAMEAIRRQNLGAALRATDDWWRGYADGAREIPKKLSDAFLRIGAARYAGQPVEDHRLAHNWSDVADNLTHMANRQRRRATRNARRDLPPLNPKASGLARRDGA